jgi:hypothetical protein
MARTQEEIDETSDLVPSGRNWEFGIEHLSDLTNVQFSMLNSYPKRRLNSASGVLSSGSE